MKNANTIIHEWLEVSGISTGILNIERVINFHDIRARDNIGSGLYFAAISHLQSSIMLRTKKIMKDHCE